MFDEHSFSLHKTMIELGPERFEPKKRFEMSLWIKEGRKGGYVQGVTLDYDADDKVDLGLRFNEAGEIVTVTVPEELVKGLDLEKGHPIFESVDVVTLIDPREARPSDLVDRIDAYMKKTLGMDLRAMMLLGTQPLVQVIDTFGLSPDFNIEPSLSSYEPPALKDFPLFIAHDLISWRREDAMRTTDAK